MEGFPGMPESRFLLWTNVNRLHPQSDSIETDTSGNKHLRYGFRRNLQFEELDQIHEFCRHYL